MLLIFVSPLMLVTNNKEAVSVITVHCAGRSAPLDSAQQEQDQDDN